MRSLGQAIVEKPMRSSRHLILIIVLVMSLSAAAAYYAGGNYRPLLRRRHRPRRDLGDHSGSVSPDGAGMTDCADLKTQIMDWTNRQDFSDALVTSLIRQAEEIFNRDLRIDRMLSANDALIASRCAPLPPDWLEMDLVRIAVAPSAYYPSGFAPIVYKPRAEFFATRDENAVGIYTIEGRQIFVGGLPDTVDGQTVPGCDYYAEVRCFQTPILPGSTPNIPAFISTPRFIELRCAVRSARSKRRPITCRVMTDGAIQKLNAQHPLFARRAQARAHTHYRSFG